MSAAKPDDENLAVRRVKTTCGRVWVCRKTRIPDEEADTRST